MKTQENYDDMAQSVSHCEDVLLNDINHENLDEVSAKLMKETLAMLEKLYHTIGSTPERADKVNNRNFTEGEFVKLKIRNQIGSTQGTVIMVYVDGVKIVFDDKTPFKRTRFIPYIDIDRKVD
jgi:hypothetical protein